MQAIKKILMERDGHTEAEADNIVKEILENSTDAVDQNDMEGIEAELDAWNIPADFIMNVLTALATRVG
jgi:hypothetical protein